MICRHVASLLYLPPEAPTAALARSVLLTQVPPTRTAFAGLAPLLACGLTQLSVGVNQQVERDTITDAGMEALAAALAVDTSLVSLEFENVTPTAGGTAALFRAIGSNSTLQSLRWCVLIRTSSVTHGCMCHAHCCVSELPARAAHDHSPDASLLLVVAQEVVVRRRGGGAAQDVVV